MQRYVCLLVLLILLMHIFDNPISINQATELVAQGARLQQPSRCPDDIFSLMLQCWSENPAQRPSFANLVQHFASSSEYDNVKNLLQGVSTEPIVDNLIETTAVSFV